MFYYNNIWRKGLQRVWRNNREFSIYIANLKFELRHESHIRVWDKNDFTRSSKPSKCIFQENRVSLHKKVQRKKNVFNPLIIYVLYAMKE